MDNRYELRYTKLDFIIRLDSYYKEELKNAYGRRMLTLLEKYKNNKCTKEEEKAIEKWLVKNFDNLQYLWNMSRKVKEHDKKFDKDMKKNARLVRIELLKNNLKNMKNKPTKINPKQIRLSNEKLVEYYNNVKEDIKTNVDKIKDKASNIELKKPKLLASYKNHDLLSKYVEILKNKKGILLDKIEKSKQKPKTKTEILEEIIINNFSEYEANEILREINLKRNEIDKMPNNQFEQAKQGILNYIETEYKNNLKKR